MADVAVGADQQRDVVEALATALDQPGGDVDAALGRQCCEARLRRAVAWHRFSDARVVVAQQVSRQEQLGEHQQVEPAVTGGLRLLQQLARRREIGVDVAQFHGRLRHRQLHACAIAVR